MRFPADEWAVCSLQLASVYTYRSLGSLLQQILEGHIRVKMFGVGRIVEGIVKDSLQNVRCALSGSTRGVAMLHEPEQ